LIPVAIAITIICRKGRSKSRSGGRSDGYSIAIIATFIIIGVNCNLEMMEIVQGQFDDIWIL